MPNHPKFPEYVERDRVLRKMGFANYRAYLASPLWASIRQRVLSRDGHKCRHCRKRTATHVHHKRYHRGDLNGHCLTRIIAVCAGCHRWLEFEQGQKNSLRTANRKYQDSWCARVMAARRHERDFDALCDNGVWPYLRST